MATIDLGKIKLLWRGTYNNSTAYAVDDVVAYTDSGVTSSYICTAASTGNAPSSSGTAHGSWAYLAKGAAVYTSTLTTQGDILYRDGSGEARLAKGTAGQILQMNSGATAPEWAAAAAGGLTHNSGNGGDQNVWYIMTSSESAVNSNSWTETITLSIPQLSEATRFFVTFTEDRREQSWNTTSGQYQASGDNGSNYTTYCETWGWYDSSNASVGSNVGGATGANVYMVHSGSYLASFSSGDTPKFRIRGIKYGSSNHYRSGGQKGYQAIVAIKVAQ
tara:strand:- start:524 stop:1351 length:828 start_codon:yes stop_codon:yes gene_type:complete